MNEPGNALDSNEPKKCCNCKRTFPRGDFPIGKAHGRIVVRSWCAECLKLYYRDYKRRIAARKREAAKP